MGRIIAPPLILVILAMWLVGAGIGLWNFTSGTEARYERAPIPNHHDRKEGDRNGYGR